MPTNPQQDLSLKQQVVSLNDAVHFGPEKILNPERLTGLAVPDDGNPVLVILAAGKGTRFGQAPKCAQAVCGVPLARHSINAFAALSPHPAVCVVGYQHEEVSQALGPDNVYVLSDNFTGGTAFAALEAFSVSQFEYNNSLLIITMGDRIVTESTFRRLVETHQLGPREAELTLLSAIYEPPKNRGKGRIVRGTDRKVHSIVEQRDIDGLNNSNLREQLQEITEGNCPLYAIRAKTLRRYLNHLTNLNAQRQYYLTDVVEAISSDGGDIRTVTTTVADPEYDLLCSDVTRPMDLALLEGLMASAGSTLGPTSSQLGQVAAQLAADRPAGQVASIAAQLDELWETAQNESIDFAPDRPVGIGVSGGRVRIAFMHPDMGRFYGPAWQMPFGARDVNGREQIVTLTQGSTDGMIHLYPTDPRFREKLNEVPADNADMYPGDDVADWYSYEGFGTRMAENLLLSLGYFSDEELELRRRAGRPLPPASLWLTNSMRRPFSLIGNAITSMRTLRSGNLGAKVQTFLGRDGFRGLRVMSTGSIPQGGFSSSSAVTVAVKNAINALFDLGIAPDMLVHLACQAEYGTGVRAGALDQATEQTGKAGQGTLISSNPRENYRIIGTYPVPSDRFRVMFAYSVDRDREAWRWSEGTYAAAAEPRRLTAGEMRKMTGKASEVAALLTRLRLDKDFFQYLEPDLVRQGRLNSETQDWVYGVLRQLPLCIEAHSLRDQLQSNRQWYVEQLIEFERMPADRASEKADVTLDSLLSGYRDPTLRRTDAAGNVVEEYGIPLRAMVAYLFAEIARNFHLIFHPDQWIESITQSQRGDRCFDIDPDALPDHSTMLSRLNWERDVQGPALLHLWLQHSEATPFDFNQDLLDADLERPTKAISALRGSNFFRGLALIDLAEAMLKRAFGPAAVAVRVNAAGQGDYFQIHVDTDTADVEAVKRFVQLAFYDRFGLTTTQPFVDPHPGGGAAGVRLERFDRLPDLVARLRQLVSDSGA
jgi:hypothetical protein